MLKVFEISRMTNHNGPGIRTLVHFKGCPMRCIWCSTPESQRREEELQFKPARCIGDGACMKICPAGAVSMTSGQEGRPNIDRSRCTECFACVNECYAHALCKCGKNWTAEALAEEICRDEIFFSHSGGGVTFSGGEPLMFVDEEMTGLYRNLYEKGITIGVDTTGHVSWKNIEAVLPFVQFFLWDLKVMDSERHREYTGVDNALLLDNLKKVEENAGKYNTKVHIRCVQIPGMTDDDENLKETCRFLKNFTCVETLDLVNFHHLGRKRYEALGRPYLMGEAAPLTAAELVRKQSLAESMGIRCRIG